MLLMKTEVAKYPAADITIERISDLKDFNFEELIK